MGREIRRVPADWKHPTAGGYFVPLLDQDYESACDKWWREASAWHYGYDFVSDQDRDMWKKNHKEHRWYWDWGGAPPDEDAGYYRPVWTDAERTHYQIYEIVTEGTPVSPVFASLDEMVAWMILPIDRSLLYNAGAADWQCMQGRTLKEARQFVRVKVSSSLIVIGGKVVDGVTVGPAMAEREPKESADG